MVGFAGDAAHAAAGPVGGDEVEAFAGIHELERFGLTQEGLLGGVALVRSIRERVAILSRWATGGTIATSGGLGWVATRAERAATLRRARVVAWQSTCFGVRTAGTDRSSLGWLVMPTTASGSITIARALGARRLRVRLRRSCLHRWSLLGGQLAPASIAG